MHKLGFTFNGRRLPEIWMADGRSKAPFAPLARDIVKISGGHRLRKTERELQEITQPINFKASTAEELLHIKQLVSDWLVTEQVAPLNFDDEPGLTYWCVVMTVEGWERMERSNLYAANVQFTCLNVTGATKTLELGTAWANHEVTGQVPTPWTSRTVFGGETKNFTIENDKSGKILLNYTFGENDVLEIDYEKRLIKLNGVARMPLLSLDSNWFKLQPGVNRMRASHETVVTYSETYH